MWAVLGNCPPLNLNLLGYECLKGVERNSYYREFMTFKRFYTVPECEKEEEEESRESMVSSS